MATKKLIHVNPELFTLGGSKTKKSREKKELKFNPLVSPNNLKNKLLKRIKEHKINETKNSNQSSIPKTNSNNENYSDEFYGAMNYLSDLTKKQKTNKFTIEAKQRALNTKTLKNHTNNIPNQISASNSISLDLPTELQESFNSTSFIPQNNEVYNVNYKVNDDVPYGCLKGGRKQTYREWKGIIKPEKIDTPDIIRPPTPPKKNLGVAKSANLTEEQLTRETKLREEQLSRVERLEQIKNKLKKMQDQETLQKQKAVDDFKELEKKFSSPLLEELPDLEDTNNDTTEDIEELLAKRKEKQESEKIKNYLKKTVKRKFTLGKSDKLRRVSVLIKDRQTRKNIINTQKELKKTNITDVRKYLRQHGMIKVGSTCPPDILRKTFESAVLTGEVVNTNSDILLHNFMAGDKE